MIKNTKSPFSHPRSIFIIFPRLSRRKSHKKHKKVGDIIYKKRADNMSALFSTKSLFWDHNFVIFWTVKDFYISANKFVVWIKIPI